LEDLDAVALLWRLKLISKDKLSDWKELLPHWESYSKNSFYLHAFLVFLANGKNDLANELMESSINNNCNIYNKKMLIHIFEGLKFFSEGDYVSAYHALSVILNSIIFFGGSNAQRDLLEMTAIVAAIHAGYLGKAKKLILGEACSTVVL